MKRLLATVSVAALASLGLASGASAAPADAACFGQVHKAVNAGALPDVSNVGQLVKAVGGGQAKNMAATSLCGG